MEIISKVLKKFSTLGKRKGDGEGDNSINGSQHLLQACKRMEMGGERECNPPKQNKDHMLLRLPVDIITEILSRIPGSDLIRLRLTCKLFYNLTYDHSFVSLHLDRAHRTTPPRVLIFSPPERNAANMNLSLLDKWVPKYNLKLPSDGSLYRMTASCNGIVCIYDSGGGVQLLNPTTRERLALPEPTNVAGNRRYLPVCYFGFHPVSNKYKILRTFGLNVERSFDMINAPLNFTLQCEVLTVGAGSWRKICSIDYDPHKDGVSINGTMFWIVDETEAIVSINLEDEKFATIPLPSPEVMVNGATLIAELEESVCFSFSRFDSLCSMEIWLLKDLANHVWIHKYRINVEQAILSAMGGRSDWCVTMMFIYGKKLFSSWPNSLRCHDLESEEESFEIMYRTERVHMARIHVESLVSLRDL